MLNKFKSTYNEFPPRFWILVVASFVDRVGGTLIFPFFALYITQKFNVGMTQAGVLIGIFSFSGLIGNMLGGALTDRFGRRVMVLFGLVFSALSSVAMGLVNQLYVFYILAVIVGFLSDIAGPAWQAMIADILPEEKRAEGFGILRVVGNMAWIVGPSIGGLMAARSYLMLFVMDAVSSLITAAIIYRMIPETMPKAAEEGGTASMLATLAGYRKVLTDRLYMAYIIVSMLMLVVYIQLYNTLSVYLRDVHGVSPQGYGFLLTMSAVTVILFQFWVTRRVKIYPPFLMMALGAAFYLVGFSMYGFVSAYALFVAAVVLITVGEMIVMPVGQALAANFAPEDMRGRYLALFSLAWALPATVGPGVAGLILDNFNPNWVWYASGMLCFLAVVGFLALNQATRARLTSKPPKEPAAATSHAP
ncbi:MAG: MFS transporter [Anaerolineales bacterium]|nr:MFS transporter [Anaerolineales bacterium]